MLDFINQVGYVILGELVQLAAGLITGMVVVLGVTSIFRGNAIYRMGED